MTRSITLLIAIAMLSGCRGDSPAASVDPFGRTRVEPPRTGSVGMQSPEKPHLLSSREAVASPPNISSAESGTTPATTVPKVGNRYEPPGGSYNFKGSSIEQPPTVASSKPGDRVTIPAAARQFADRSGDLAGRGKSGAWPKPLESKADSSTIPATATSSAVAVASSSTGGTSGSGPGGRQRIRRTIQPQPSESADPSPRRLNVPGEATNIMDLPTAGTSDAAHSSSGASGIRLVSAVEELDGGRSNSSPAATSGGDAKAFSPRSHYSHAPDYGWLRGRLEYSQSDRSWKLRYIPINGDTDDFGGSVVLAVTPLLSGYERGDFVEVRGEMGAVSSEEHGYAPDFHIDRIKHLPD